MQVTHPKMWSSTWPYTFHRIVLWSCFQFRAQKTILSSHHGQQIYSSTIWWKWLFYWHNLRLDSSFSCSWLILSLSDENKFTHRKSSWYRDLILGKYRDSTSARTSQFRSRPKFFSRWYYLREILSIIHSNNLVS